MIRLSSNKTLIIAIFLPLTWFVFFGAFGAAIWLTDPEDIISVSGHYSRIFYSIFFILIGALIYWKMMSFRRVEYDKEFIYISNYFKTVKTPFHQVANITKYNFIGSLIIKINLKHKGLFGNKIRCITDQNALIDFESKRQFAIV